MGKPRYRHIIWDWNGTLLNDVSLSIEVMNGLLREHGHPPIDRHCYQEIFDFPVRTYYERAGFDFSRHSFEELGSRWIAAYEARRQECRLQPGARSILQRIQTVGLTQSILSAYPQNTLHEIVRHFGLETYFVRILGLDNIYAHSKVELGQEWIAELGVPGKEILLVGDTLHDLDVAQAIGVDCVLVACGHHPEARLRSRTDHVVADLSGLSSFVP